MTFKEIEKIILADGWILSSIEGSHHHYKHPRKQGKVTIPKHTKPKDLSPIVINSILKQAGLK